METMDKQKTKYGIVEKMPNGRIFGYVNVFEMSEEMECEILENYIDLGYEPLENKYIMSGGNIDSLGFKFVDEDGIPQEGEVEYVNHGILIMKTKLKIHVPTQD